MAEESFLVRDESGGLETAVCQSLKEPSGSLIHVRWRVTESSSIILLLLDSRCPPLHAPPSLRTYIQGLRPRKEVILVLTKADLVDPEALMQWKRWIAGWWGEDEVQVVSVMSYDLELLHAGKCLLAVQG